MNKLFFKKHPLMFRLWYYLLAKGKKAKYDLPKNGDDFFFDGFPRSGNTFLKNLILFQDKNLVGSSHLHSIAGIKMALSKGIPVIVIIRKPIDAITSYLYTRIHRNKSPDVSGRKKISKQLVKEWLDFYSFVKEQEKFILVIDFSDARNNSADVVRRIFRWIERPTLPEEEIKIGVQEYYSQLRKKEEQKELAYSSLPSVDRKNQIEEYKTEVEFFLSDEVLDLFNSLTIKNTRPQE